MRKGMRSAITWMCLATSLLMVGCLSFRGLKPGPADFERWNNPEAAKIALLECGAPNPINMIREISKGERALSKNEVVLVERCMLNSGFRHKKTNSYSNYVCHFRPELDACKKEAVVPVRDKSRRLNGPYCTHSLYSTYPECQP